MCELCSAGKRWSESPIAQGGGSFGSSDFFNTPHVRGERTVNNGSNAPPGRLVLQLL